MKDTPPYNLDAERAVLGSVLMSSKSLHDVADMLSIDSFYSSKHRLVYVAMLGLHSKNTDIDILTVSNKLKDDGTIKDIGGAAYLSDLVLASTAPSSIRHYAEIVQNKYTMRRLLDAGKEIQAIASDESDSEEALGEVQKIVFDISNTSSVKKYISSEEGLRDAIEQIESIEQHESGLRGTPTGFPAIDSMLSGLQKSDLVILAARPSMGKTALAMDMARKTAVKHGTPVGIFSLEMSAQQLFDRMLSAESGVDSWKLRIGKVTDEDKEKLKMAIDVLSAAPLYIDDNPNSNMLSIRSIARRMKIERGLKLIIVDYLQLINPDKRHDSMVQQVAEISRSLKAMARELEIPVLALSQLNRAAEQHGGSPRLSDLRDSGSIEQDADVVMFIHRDKKKEGDDETKKDEMTKIFIAKHRNGPTGMVKLKFDEQRTTFLSVDFRTEEQAI